MAVDVERRLHADDSADEAEPTMCRLRILHLEDDPHDRDLTEATLRSGGLDCVYCWVDDRAGFERALIGERFDVILADYNLPAFDGLTAYAVAQRLSPQTPFIVLSGILGDELAVSLIKDGATDYVLKQRIRRLPSAVLRARREARERADRQQAEDRVRRLNAALEERVAARTEELAEANRALARREAQCQTSEQWLHAILDYSPVAIYVKAVDGRYLLANRRTEALIGRTDVVGKSDAELVAPRLADMYLENDRRVMTEMRALKFEEAALQSNGVIRVLASTKFPLFDQTDTLYAICGISEDVTERKKAEDELKLARLEAQRANLAKSEFLSRMSHDLRTPLNAILGFAQILEPVPMDAAHQDSVRQILQAGRHLLDLINDVLEISRIESGSLGLSLEAVTLAGVVGDAVEIVKPLAAIRDLRVTVQPWPASAPVLWADRHRLMQILLNLLSNAVKYNRPGGAIDVGFQSREAGRQRITIRDTGFGIPADKLKLLFQPFERLGADRTSVEGTGLGLSLSRGLAEAMGGSLGVESIVDEGSVFWIEMPEAAPAACHAVAIDPAERATAPVRESSGTVLYIEDNASNVRLMERILQPRHGISLIHAADGHRGYELAKAGRPDLILLDMHLPDTSGEDVIRWLWEDADTRHIPICVLTADATPGLVRRLIAAGASQCFTKPLEVRQILQTIDELLRNRAGASHATATSNR